MLVAKAKRSALLVLHAPSVSVVLAPRSPVASTVPAVKIAVKEAVVMVIVRASQIVHVVKIAVKVVVPRKKMKGDCGLMIASATAMKRGVNVLGISALSISRPSLEVAMSSY